MLFARNIFPFLFLPIVLSIYYILMRNRKTKNLFLLIVSLMFYSYGEPKFIYIVILSIVVNYIFGILINYYRKQKWSKIFLILSIIYNIGLLSYFKYFNFFIDNFNFVFKTNFLLRKTILPIGISFLTFQILSYLIDVRRFEAIRLIRYIEKVNLDAIVFLYNAGSLYDFSIFSFQLK